MNKFAICLLLALPLTPFANAQTPQADSESHPVTSGLKQKLTKLTLTNASFVEKSTQSSLAEIELSKLALGKSKDTSIQRFAQQMVDDHTAALKQIGPIAKSKSLEVPTQLDDAHERKIKKLNGMSEPEFNKAYIKQMQEDHDKAVSLFSAATDDKNIDPELKEAAAKLLPTLRDHQHAAHSLHSS